MDRYLIESPHEAADCEAIIKEIHAAGYLHQFEWGCHDGEHCGWAIVETDNKTCKQMIPGEYGTRLGFKTEKFGEADKTHS
jgi:hypothetical protein